MKPARIVLIDMPQFYRQRLATRADNPQKKTKSGAGAHGNYSRGTMAMEDLIRLGEYIKAIASPDAYIFSWITIPNIPFCSRLLGEEGHTVGLWGTYFKTMVFVWIKKYANGDDFCGGGRYSFANIESVGLARYPNTECWHPNTGYTPLQPLYDEDVSDLVCEPHERYPKDIFSLLWEERHPTIPPCPNPVRCRNAKLLEVAKCKRCSKASQIVHSRKPETVQDRIDEWLNPHLDGHLKVELFATRKRPGWLTLGADVTGNDIFSDLRLLAMEIDISN